MSKDTIAPLKDAHTHASNVVDDLNAQVTALEAAKEVDKPAIRGVKAKLKTANAAAKRAATAVTKEEARIEREAEKEAKAKSDEKVAKEAEKEAKAEAAEEAKKAKAAEREASRMPEQNGTRLPKPGTKTRKIWDMIDKLNKELGQTTPVKNLLERALPEGCREATVKAQYARWRKFHGVSGRITLPAKNESKAA